MGSQDDRWYKKPGRKPSDGPRISHAVQCGGWACDCIVAVRAIWCGLRVVRAVFPQCEDREPENREERSGYRYVCWS
jgi:hypothetical protein